jgi:hypothetical protein
MNLDGKNISGTQTYHKNILVIDDNINRYYITPEELTAILSHFLFKTEKKKNRWYLQHVQPDVELLYEEERYDGNEINENVQT